MRPLRTASTLAAAGLLALSAACASASGRTAADSAAATVLLVRNHNFNDMNVWAANTGGQATLLGFAPGESTTRFTLPAWVIGRDQMRLTADPIGGSRGFRSDPLVVNAGDTVTFSIEQQLALSVATVR